MTTPTPSQTPPWILASSSPRRRELLEKIGVQFRVRTAHSEEISHLKTPAEIVQDLAMQKALAVAALEPQAQILAADTIVVLDDHTPHFEILNKPADSSENRAMLERLQGRSHAVYTGVAMLTPNVRGSAFERTEVHFRSLSTLEMAWYVQTGEGLDKAGGYGIQEKGMLLVSKIVGDYFNVMGLPMVQTLELSRTLGLVLVEGLGNHGF